ncbi:MAG: hypothetical protein MJ177_08400 [Clostridia bacterium]|nr:hypothetical protein [Clostridia bacterium]
MLTTAEYAKNARNAVQAVYTTTARKAYRMSNSMAVVTHKLAGVEKTADLTDRNGNAYFTDGFRTFYTDKNGVEHSFENSTETGRVNTIRLGEYYYECHIRDLAKCNFKVDKAFHVFSDRLYVQYSFLADKPTEKLFDFGSKYTIPYTSVTGLAIKDKNGIHNKINCIDSESVEYIAFDTKDTGVVGFIVPSDGSTKKLTVTLGALGYTVKQYAAFDPSAGLNDYTESGGYELNKITFGCRVYTDGTHSFDGIEKAAYEERNPLEGITVEKGTANSTYLGYDALRGVYTVQMDGTDFQTAYDNPQMQFTAPISISSNDDRTVYFRSYGLSGCLEAAAIIDSENQLVPMEVQVCKNFRDDGGEPFYSVKDYQYGDAFFPVCVRGGEQLDFTLVDLYQNWGCFPIKQLSSIEFHTSYYHISTGTTESNCIAPYFVFEKDGWTLPDFRCRSGNIWSGQPQFNSVGILKFMSHTNKVWNTVYYNELAGTEIASTGLAYCDIRNTYVDDCGDFTFTLRHAEMPQTDENRTYYTVKVKFDRDVTYRDFRNEFELFNFDGRFVKFNKACFLNENNEPESVDVYTGEKVRFYTLGTEAPVYGFYDVTDDTEYQIDNCFGCNFALIIRDSKITVSGKESNIPFVFRDSSTADMTNGILTLDADVITFKKGDTIELNMVLLPWGTGREESYDTVMKVREDSALKPVAVTAKTGTVVEDDIIHVVRAENGKAEFTVKGGRNNNAVVVEGFTSMKAPAIEILKDGEWTEYVTASEEHGYDGYSVKIADDGTYTFSFLYEAESPDAEYTFRVTGR